MINNIKRFTIKGLVQGVGYRPFIVCKAKENNIKGYVLNTNGIVDIFAQGSKDDIDSFYKVISNEAPQMAKVETISFCDEETNIVYEDFSIKESESKKADEFPYISPDLTICDRCEKELFDKNNRRFLHPFISCTSCGPRFSIINKIPYDRENITMTKFEMCKDCYSEYIKDYDVRQHAQTIACKNCGPELTFEIMNGKSYKGNDSYLEAISFLKKGGIVAIKDIGGYHLAVCANNDLAIDALRELKGREKKPFAIMFPTIESIEKECVINDDEKNTLISTARPIVLVERKDKTYHSACGNSPYIGAMLPCNPLQILLLKECGPLIMTSANRSGEMIIIDNDKIVDFMKYNDQYLDYPMAVLSHDRDILCPLDDSILYYSFEKMRFMRRARGYVPEPIYIANSEDLLCLGGDLKACFSINKNNKTILSQHLSDLEDFDANRAYNLALERMLKLYDFTPKVIVADMHPGYFSHKKAKDISEKYMARLELVQHHKAHVASVMFENNIDRCLGFAFDGTGYGEDNTIWGSEVFQVEKNKFTRVNHLQKCILPGSDDGSKNNRRTLYGYLTNFDIDIDGIDYLDKEEYNIVSKAIKFGINTVTSTSMGRLFDAMSALLNICNYNEYEGEGPIELEYCAMKAEKPYPLAITDDLGSLFKEVIFAIKNGEKTSDIALGFIHALAKYIENICDNYSEKNICLSGGTFNNRILTNLVGESLSKKGYNVYFNEKVPTGDGGIALGQGYFFKGE